MYQCIGYAMFTVHQNILNYVYNSLKYKKLNNKLYEKVTTFDCKFDLV